MSVIEFCSGPWIFIATVVITIILIVCAMAVAKEEDIYAEGLKLAARPQIAHLSRLLKDKDEGALE